MKSTKRLMSVVMSVVAGLALLHGDDAKLFAQALPPFEVNSREAAIVDSSAQVIREIMSIPASGIPASLLADAQGIVIVPGMLKGGFVIGVERGHGVVLVRDPAGQWQLPQFLTMTGGSLGWQAGIQATDLVLVFKTTRSVQGLLNDKFTIGVDAAAAAGPVGRNASASTDATLQAEIYSYSRSRGLFAGLALDGSKLQIDRNATSSYYRPPYATPAGQAAPVPASSLRLIQEINRYTTNVAVVAPVQAAPPGQVAGAANPATVRQQLAAASQRLAGIVDEAWRNHLALPAEAYGGDAMPSVENLELALSRFQAVAAHPEYAALASRPEFTETTQLLQQMISLLPRPALALPPPPQ